MRINIGCGQSPTPGWRNFDNSPSLRLARFPAFVGILRSLGFLDDAQLRFTTFCAKNAIEWADATKSLSLADSSVEVLYTSHMLEHLDQNEAESFLSEARRLLRSGGVIRIAVPDLALHVRDYLENRDADAFVEAMRMTERRPRKLLQRLRAALVGGRHHRWMYDGRSLCRLLERAGFREAVVLKPGETRIVEPGRLDLYERSTESVYVEAVSP